MVDATSTIYLIQIASSTSYYISTLYPLLFMILGVFLGFSILSMLIYLISGGFYRK